MIRVFLKKGSRKNKVTHAERNKQKVKTGFDFQG